MVKNKSLEKVAELACLKIEEGKQVEFQGHFDKILQYFDVLKELDTDEIVPMVTPHDVYPKLRDDEVRADLDVDSLLQNAPDVKDSLFKVPPVV